jgi:diguanylate cyclase (GGDEF)-like protein
MVAQTILIMGILILAGGSASLLIVRLCSSGLRGVAWLSGAFASGTVGTALLLLRNHVVSVLAGDVALLNSFVLLHIAVLHLARVTKVRVWHGLALLCVQALVDGAKIAGWTSGRPRIVAIGLLVALQAAATAAVLFGLARGKVRAPALYSAVLLLCFGVLNIVRSLVIATGSGTPFFRQRLGFATFVLFIAVALGLAFGFFWMTTSSLTAEVEYIASTDPLTRVYNRRVFMKWCEKELLRTQRSSVPFSILMVDLDHFKQINDNFGHQRGDEVLCAMVERMQDSVRGIDVLCRWGGEEFAVLLPNAPEAATQIVAERIRANVQRMMVPLSEPTRDAAASSLLTVSIGAATYRDLDDDIAAMLLRADRALYKAKTSGRNRVLVAS